MTFTPESQSRRRENRGKGSNSVNLLNLYPHVEPIFLRVSRNWR